MKFNSSYVSSVGYSTSYEYSAYARVRKSIDQQIEGGTKMTTCCQNVVEQSYITRLKIGQIFINEPATSHSVG